MIKPKKISGFGVQWLALAGALAAIGASMGYTQWHSGVELERQEAARLETQVRVADQVLSAQIASVDAGLRTLIEGVDRWRMADGFVPFAMEHLKRVEKMIPAARTFVVLNSKGDCQLSNHPELVGQNFQQRAYFREAMHLAPNQQLVVSAPYRTALGAWAVTLSRPLHNPTGEPIGVVAATLSADYFQNLVSNLSYAPDMRVTLIHTSGTMYTTAPPSAELSEANYLQPGTFTQQHLESGRKESFIQGQSVLPGLPPRMTALRNVDLPGFEATHGFVALAGRNIDAVYADWHKDNGMYLALFVALALGSAASMALYQRWVRLLQLQRREARRELERSHARYQQLADTLPAVLFDHTRDAKGSIQHSYVSPFSHTLLGVPAEQLMADPALLPRMVHPADWAAFKAEANRAAQSTTPFSGTYRMVRPDSQTVWVQMTATPTPVAGPSPQVLWSGAMFDVTERMHLEAELRELAYHDPLTGAHNRRSFMAQLQNELDRVQRTQQSAAVLMLDIDHFKQVNDTWGHDAGDVVLKALVNTLGQELRRIDMLGRLGGEEFAVLLPATDATGALELAERLRTQVESAAVAWPTAQPDGLIHITISLGVALLTADDHDAVAVLKIADHALYEAKHTGRNRVVMTPVAASDLTPAAN